MSLESIGALITAMAAFLTAGIGFWKVNKDAKSQHDSESASSLKAHMERQDKSIEKLEKRVDAAVVRERLLGDYVFELRQHIAEGKPPPPPQWPQTLLHNLDH